MLVVPGWSSVTARVTWYAAVPAASPCRLTVPFRAAVAGTVGVRVGVSWLDALGVGVGKGQEYPSAITRKLSIAIEAVAGLEPFKFRTNPIGPDGVVVEPRLLNVPPSR